MDRLTKGQIVEGNIKILEVKDFPHPADKHLQYVLVHRTADTIQPYVTYMYNVEFGGFSYGHYCSTLEDGKETYKERLNYYDII